MKTVKRILLILLVLSLIITQAGCTNSKETDKPGSKSGSPVMGEDWLLHTYCYIKIMDEDCDETVIREAFQLAREYENKLSRTIADSEIASGNYSEETQALVDQALVFEDVSGGKFCIHLGSVSDLWDFGETNGGPFVPASEDIEAALAAQTVDLGAIAKGYIADRLADFLKERGVKSAIISLGGNIYCVGTKPDGSEWQIGIEKPFSVNGQPLETRESIGTVSAAADSSVVTSGVYERCFTDDDGTFYHHILDPETGYPCKSDIVSASIIGPSSCICDALATISVLLGSKAAEDFILDYNSVAHADRASYEYIFILDSGEIIQSDGISPHN